jgi:uncharacterized protein YigA (DUF484 family)
MSTKQPSGGQEQELSWDEAVARYLTENPDYFLHHPEALGALTLRHHASGQVASLIERQVQVLRDKNEKLERQLRELLSHARENDVLGERLHQFAMAMLDSGALDEVLSTARDMLRQQFKLDAVVILLKGDAEVLRGRPECAEPGDRRFDGIVQKFAASAEATALPARSQAGKPLCGARHDSDTLGYLFGSQAQDIRSSALVLLAGKDTTGVLCLGSSDPQRFHPQMGTLYLSKFGELLMAAISRFL